MIIKDFHTHVEALLSIVDIDPSDPAAPLPLRPGLRYSVGIHPWRVGIATPDDWARTILLAADPRVLLIGETGLDRLHLDGTPIELQIEWFERHVSLSEQVGKPLLLHIVRAFPEIIALRRRLRPTQPWIVHGFRGKPQLAASLLSHGFLLRFGPLHNPSSLALTPTPLRESDRTPTT